MIYWVKVWHQLILHQNNVYAIGTLAPCYLQIC